ncbi:hypothetical protein C9374_007964 [Naegleria lovaniensis]|uniref:F-box domain-containing protein n=1 Tax=Naegleria lovaniensis TaxID=51637 RepID=A0AA88GLS8_NAELO|nr:uncharacterized protein C9374_007964 [Naegleria lovaniensis]KAG2378816.1 hypothetical protein C9374_007964 [Naegleria lovaniensis]
MSHSHDNHHLEFTNNNGERIFPRNEDIHEMFLSDNTNTTMMIQAQPTKKNKGDQNVTHKTHLFHLADELISSIFYYCNTFEILSIVQLVCKQFFRLVNQDSSQLWAVIGFEMPLNSQIVLTDETFNKLFLKKRNPQVWSKVVLCNQNFLSKCFFEHLFMTCIALERVVIRECSQFHESSIPILLNMAPSLKQLEVQSCTSVSSFTTGFRTAISTDLPTNKFSWSPQSKKPLLLTNLCLTSFKSTDALVQLISDNYMPHLKELKIARPPARSINLSHISSMTNKLSELEYLEITFPLFFHDFTQTNRHDSNNSSVIVDNLIQALLFKKVPLIRLSLEGVVCSIKTFINIFSRGFELQHLTLDLHTTPPKNEKEHISLSQQEEFFKSLGRLQTLRLHVDDKRRLHSHNNHLIVKYCLAGSDLRIVELCKISLTEYSSLIQCFDLPKPNLTVLKLVGTFIPSSILLQVLKQCPHLVQLVVSNKSHEFLMLDRNGVDDDEEETPFLGDGENSVWSAHSSNISSNSGSASTNSLHNLNARSGTDMTDGELAQVVAYCPNLEYMSLKSDHLTGSFVSHLQHAPLLYHLTITSRKLKFYELDNISNIRLPLIRSLIIRSKSIIDEDVKVLCCIFNSLSALSLDSTQISSMLFYHVAKFGSTLVTLNIYSSLVLTVPMVLLRSQSSSLRNIYIHRWKELPLRMYQMLQLAFPKYQHKRNIFISNNESLSFMEQHAIMKFIASVIDETFSEEKKSVIMKDSKLLDQMYDIASKILSLEIILENAIEFEDETQKMNLINELKAPLNFLSTLFESFNLYQDHSYQERLQHFLRSFLELPFKEIEEQIKYSFHTK